MKFAHISDLHLGKRLHQFSMIEDQRHILKQMIDIVRREEVEGIFISGDVYDKIYPSSEAVALFDEFLVGLAEYEIKVFVISGNHDSPERIAFLGELTKKSGVYLAPVYRGEVTKVRLEDKYGNINVYMLPFIKPVHVRHYFPDEEINDYTEAMEVVVKHMNLNLDERNILLAHQFVTGARRSDSEEITVGGLDNISASAFETFDYVALGHIHSPQEMVKGKVRYCGTPLKYSFSESTDKKSLTMIEAGKKGQLIIQEIPLIPQKDLLKIKGSFIQVMNPHNYPEVDINSYLHVTLTDEEDIPEAFHRLSCVYPNIMQMCYDNKRTRGKDSLQHKESSRETDPLKIISGLYEEMNHQQLSSGQITYLMEKIEKIW